MNQKLHTFRRKRANRPLQSAKKMGSTKALRKLDDNAAADSQKPPSPQNDAGNVSPKYGVDALDKLRREHLLAEERGRKRNNERGRDIDKRRRDTIAELYAIALFLQSDSAEWKKLCDRAYWETAKKKPSISQPEDALRHTIHYFHQSNGNKKAQKQSSKHFKLLEPYFEQGTPRNKVRLALKSGVENLRRAASKPLADSKPYLKISISEKSFSKLKLGKTVKIRLAISAIFEHWAAAKLVKNDD